MLGLDLDAIRTRSDNSWYLEHARVRDDRSLDKLNPVSIAMIRQYHFQLLVWLKRGKDYN